MKPTLLILAAGMGSRYGGLKQLDGVGPSGETIMDYSVYDALRAGFGKVVFVIRKSFEKEFREKVVSKYEKHISVEIVFQDISDIPQGFELNSEREKPWGTSHALLMAKDVIKEPFASINADDFYGKESYQILAEQLNAMVGKTNEYCMIGYLLGNTLSDSGSVARGICEVDAESYLKQIVERAKIERVDGVAGFMDESDNWVRLKGTTMVSMNIWGLTPDYFDITAKDFVSFLNENENNLKAEFLIPTHINSLVQKAEAKVKLFNTPSKWFGVTYQEDRPGVVSKIQQLVKEGEYPQPLF